jgi:hypothetical protein
MSGVSKRERVQKIGGKPHNIGKAEENDHDQ